MKTAKKILALVLVLTVALTMGAAMGLTAFAASGTNANTKGHLSVSNAEDGQTYTAYKVLDLQSFDSDTHSYSYKVAVGWMDFFTSGAGATYFTLDSSGQVIGNTLETATNEQKADFAKAALKFAQDNSIPGVTVSSEPTEVGLGYYVVGTTLGALCALDTTNPDVAIYEKNSKPSVDKTVKDSDDPDTGYAESATADVGEVVNYKMVVNTGTNTHGVNAGINSDYVIEDVMTNVTYITDSFTISGGRDSWTLGTDYTVDWDASAKKLTITLMKDSIKDLLTNVDITIKYNATVDTTAVSNDATANANTATLTYNNETSTDTAYVKTFKFSVLKNDGTNPLDGAQFVLSTTEDETDALPFATLATNQYQYQSGTGAGTTITTDDTGAFSIEGLDAGTYYLIETVPPTGYNKLNAPIKVEIAEDGTITFTPMNTNDNTSSEGTEVTIVNHSGAELPETGGIGTTIFYILGALLVIVCGIVLVARRRMAAK